MHGKVKSAFFKILILIALVFCILFIYQRIDSKNKTTNHNISPRGLFLEINESIAEEGIRKAYNSIKSRYSSYPAEERHLALHIFGEVIYEKIGESGIEVCDETYGYGCYHGLFLSAVAGKGLNIVSKLDIICQKQENKRTKISCQHGIGHGILEYMGPDNLAESLVACESTSWQGSLLGCRSGVFMEYYLPTKVTQEQTVLNDPREYDEEKPYSPCTDVNQFSKTDCYHQLPRWWQEILGQDYLKIGSLCGAIADDEFKALCYNGMGSFMIPKIGYDVEKIIRNCKMIPNIEGEIACRAGAAWVFSFSTKYKDLYPLLCVGVGRQELCLEDINKLRQLSN